MAVSRKREVANEMVREKAERKELAQEQKRLEKMLKQKGRKHGSDKG